MVQEVKLHAECYRCREHFRFYNENYTNHTKIEYRLFFGKQYVRFCEPCYRGLEKFLKEKV